MKIHILNHSLLELASQKFKEKCLQIPVERSFHPLCPNRRPENCRYLTLHYATTSLSSSRAMAIPRASSQFKTHSASSIEAV
jgi:hypothetical protein